MPNPHYPEGTYGVRIDTQKLSQNERTGKYQVVIGFTPLAIEDPSVPEDAVERWQSLTVQSYPRTLYLPLTEKAAEITADKLERLEITFDEWGEVDESNPKCVAITGQKRRLTCKHESYNGKVRDRWDVPFESVQAESVDNTEAAKVQALFGRFAKGRQVAAAPKSAPIAPAAVAAPSPAPAAKRAAPQIPDAPAAVMVPDAEPGSDDLPF